MFSRISRYSIPLVLVSNLLLSTNVLSTTSRQQDQKPTSAQAAATPKSTAASPSPSPSPVADPNRGRPLAVNEDPAMIGKRNVNTGVISKMSMSLEKEVAMGRQLAAQVDQQSKFVEDPVITEYVNRVAQNLVIHSDAKIPFTVKVIDSDEVNAFALPGGFFYVNKGLILAADNEAELAGVMAHEISHVIARHGVENQTKGNLMQYGALAGMILLGPIPSMVLQNTAGLGMMLSYMKFSRNAEAEADRLGVQYLYASGYDPTALATMFEKLEGLNKKKPGTISKLFADHPGPADRRAASLALVARFPEHEEYMVNTSEFQRVKAHLLRLSNARATTAGSLPSSDGSNGAPGRPTLRRRQNTPEDSTAPANDSEQKPSPEQPSGPPKLKRQNPDGTSQSPAPQPPATP
jgi:predicted Zn-dependent protease